MASNEVYKAFRLKIFYFVAKNITILSIISVKTFQFNEVNSVP